MGPTSLGTFLKGLAFPEQKYSKNERNLTQEGFTIASLKMEGAMWQGMWVAGKVQSSQQGNNDLSPTTARN